MYVGIGIGGIFYSYDALNWYNSTTGTALINNTAAPQFGKVVWNGNMWVAVGNGQNYTIAYSSDGITWTGVAGSKTLFNASGGAMDIVWDGSKFVVVGANNAKAFTVNSSDGINWTSPTLIIIGIPSAPANLAVSASTPTSISVSFTGPSQTFSSYTIVATPTSGSTVTNTGISAAATSYTITGLVTGTQYTIAVYAVNSYGSTASTIVYQTVVGPPTSLTSSS